MRPQRPSIDARSAAGACAFAALAAGLAAFQPISNADTFGHLAQGRAIAAHGGPPERDPFSFWTPDPQPWVNYEWLSDLATWALHAVGGYDALVFAAVAIVAAGAALAVWLAARSGGGAAAWVAAILIVAGIPAFRFRLSARPHLVALPLCLAYVTILGAPSLLDDRRKTLARVSLLVVLQIAWANLHGSHLLGIGVAAASAVGALPDRRRCASLTVITATLALASCVTPWGPALTLDAIAHVFDPAYRAVVTEWDDITKAGAWTLAHTIAQCVAIVFATRSALRAGPAERTLLFTSVALAVAALRSFRFVDLLFVVSAPLVAIALSRWLAAHGPRLTSRWGTMVAATIAASASASLVMVIEAPYLPVGTGALLRYVPAEASAHIERTLPGARVLGTTTSSWYLIWGAPSARVLVDGRVPFFGPDHVRIVSNAMAHEHTFAEVVERFAPDVVLVQHTAPDERGALAAASADRRFVRTWIDASFSVYARRSAFPGVEARALEALPVSYEVTAILGASHDRIDAMRAELGRLGDGPDAQAFTAFVRAMIRVHPLAREAGWAGYRAPRDGAEREDVELASEEMAQVRRRTGDLPVVLAHSALIEALACRTEDARSTLAAARHAGEGDSRETLFAEAEIDLREGHRADVAAFLDQARALAPEDPWVAALDAEITAGIRCQEP